MKKNVWYTYTYSGVLTPTLFIPPRSVDFIVKSESDNYYKILFDDGHTTEITKNSLMAKDAIEITRPMNK